MLRPSLDREEMVVKFLEHYTKNELPVMLELELMDFKKLPGFRAIKHATLTPVTGKEKLFIKGENPPVAKRLIDAVTLVKAGWKPFLYISDVSFGVQDEEAGMEQGLLVRTQFIIVLSNQQKDEQTGAWWTTPVAVDETEFLNSCLFTAKRIQTTKVEEKVG